MTDIKIIEELVAAANLRPPTTTEAAAPAPYLEALIRKISALSDEKWEDLSIEAQDFANEAVRSISAGKPLPEVNLTSIAVDKPDKVAEKDERFLPENAKSKQTKRRNIWGAGTVTGETAAFLIDTKFADLNPVTTLIEIRKRGVKASIETADSAISETLRIVAALHAAGWIDQTIRPEQLLRDIDEVNKLL